MYPTLSHLFSDLFGIGFIPIPTFGFFVALSFIGAAYCFTVELRRKEKEGLIHPYQDKVLKGAPASVWEMLSAGFFGFLLGFKVLYIALNWSEFATDPRGVILSSKGNLLGGLLLAAYMAYKAYSDKSREKLAEPVWENQAVHPYELVSNMTMIAAFAGIVGARVFHILENTSEFAQDPMGMLFSTGGFTFYGGLIFGAAGVIWYARRHGIPTLHLIDACAPGLMLAYGVGRIGCQLSGDGDWGLPNTAAKPDWLSFLPDWAWSYTYPHNVIGEGIPIPGCEGPYCAALEVPVYPTPLYEAVMGLSLFLILWGLRKRLTTPGLLFAVYMIVNGLERFFIEKIRVNTVYEMGSLQVTQAEIISLLLILTGVAGIFWLRKRNVQQGHLH
jgi:phosphatidylglycerol---prolipoprotein diacylglyceryl transferase